MGKLFDQINQGLKGSIRTRKMFFVATAPLDGAGHVNLSPKGLDTLRVLDPRPWPTWTMSAVARKQLRISERTVASSLCSVRFKELHVSFGFTVVARSLSRKIKNSIGYGGCFRRSQLGGQSFTFQSSVSPIRVATAFPCHIRGESLTASRLGGTERSARASRIPSAEEPNQHRRSSSAPRARDYRIQIN